MIVEAASEVPNPGGQMPGRWRLNRAGIVNVYQYENEVLHFGGGRLLLRGVNGSGKSTAMNMLLPFLLTARQQKIDAAGEQVGILKSWMLSGRDDPQPVGYLWIEFECGGEFLTCGCGIKANRQSDTVTTWWFVTAKRPGLDFDLVTGGNMPVSADGLRAALDDGEVYSERQRRDYRHQIEHRLFGGASIDQHIGLIHVVRSPRVGDRIDVELPQHLTGALPQLSEEALAEAAQPLDDLEEHRRNVAELERTAAAIDGLLEVYRAYCTGELRRRLAEGRERLDTLRHRKRDEKAKHASATAAGAEVGRLDTEIADRESEVKRLGNEIRALEESKVYRSGLQLAHLESLVRDLGRQWERAGERVAHCEARSAGEATGVKGARALCRGDVERLNEDLAAAVGLAERCGLAVRPPGPARVAEAALDGLDAAEPAGSFDGAAVEQGLDGAGGALTRRRGDLAEVAEARRRLDEAVETQRRADSMLEVAVAAAQGAADRLAGRNRALARARQEWAGQVRHWASLIRPLLKAAGVEAPAVAGLVDAETPVTADHEDLREGLLGAAGALVAARADTVAAQRHRLEGERAAAAEAQAAVDELAARTEPDPPRFDWQAGVDHCLADLMDFAPGLDGARRAGLEAALEASGLLAARLTNSGGAELASGELVAVAAGGVSRPLSEVLTVTVPDRLIGVVDAGLVGKLLDSISSDPSTGAATAAGTDGSFRVGALEGRHTKARAEFIGVTARREALARERRAAAEMLERALTAVAATETELAALEGLLAEARRLQSELPGTGEIAAAAGAVDVATVAAEEAEAEKQKAAEHDVGVRLRWRRSPELDAPTARMVELLDARPDLRVEEDEQELRSLLSQSLEEARSLQPDVPYRQLIAATLDYKQWHEMAVMVQRGGAREARLGRRTHLSEGEKKIVTYLSLFAAVAASHDALAAQQPGPEQDRPGIARFVLLDDAFAKVSEDNHAALFGLLVALDLDLIATSERLWGTHSSVPQLAITEVIRDAELKAILLEHYHWDGATLARREAP